MLTRSTGPETTWVHLKSTFPSQSLPPSVPRQVTALIHGPSSLNYKTDVIIIRTVSWRASIQKSVHFLCLRTDSLQKICKERRPHSASTGRDHDYFKAIYDVSLGPVIHLGVTVWPNNTKTNLFHERCSPSLRNKIKHSVFCFQFPLLSTLNWEQKPGQGKVKG